MLFFFFWLGLFSGELIFGGAYYWKEVCVSKWVGLDNKNSLKHKDNSLEQLTLTMGLYSGGLIIGVPFDSEILVALFLEGLIFRILRYLHALASTLFLFIFTNDNRSEQKNVTFLGITSLQTSSPV